MSFSWRLWLHCPQPECYNFRLSHLERYFWVPCCCNYSFGWPKLQSNQWQPLCSHFLPHWEGLISERFYFVSAVLELFFAPMYPIINCLSSFFKHIVKTVCSFKFNSLILKKSSTELESRVILSVMGVAANHI